MIQPENFKLMSFTKENREKLALGTKLMTRRVITQLLDDKSDNYVKPFHNKVMGFWEFLHKPTNTVAEVKSPYQVGDIVGIREPYVIEKMDHGNYLLSGRYLDDNQEYIKTRLSVTEWRRLVKRQYPLRKSPSLFMYKSLCRKFYTVTAVKVERAQDISEEDAKAEGIEEWIPSADWFGYTKNPEESKARWDAGGKFWLSYPRYPKRKQTGVFDCPIKSFRSLWNSINEKRGCGFDVNPYVFAYRLKKWSGK